MRKLSDRNFICGRFSQHDEQEERDGGRGEKCHCVDPPTRHECPKHCRNLWEKQFLHISAFETLPSKGKWPAQSQDLYVIENLWLVMNRLVKMQCHLAGIVEEL